MSILSIEKPIWFMRQAGRHLPEYRKLRLKKESFLDFCFAFLFPKLFLFRELSEFIYIYININKILLLIATI